MKTQVKYLGVKRFVDEETGEVISMDVVEHTTPSDYPSGWRRMFTEAFMYAISHKSPAKGWLNVLDTIINSLNGEHQIVMSQEQIAKKAGVSYPTVNQTFKYLISIKFLKKVDKIYMFNPGIISAFGSDRKNANLLQRFKKEDPALPGMDLIGKEVKKISKPNNEKVS